MKKILTLLVMVALAACWVSCSDDDDKNGDTNKSEKRLIREIYNENSYSIKFTYDEDGYITKIEDGHYKETYTISKQGKKLTIINQYNSDKSIYWIYTLNDKGYIISDDDENYEYDNSDQMIKQTDSESIYTYTWKDGNVISEKYQDDIDKSEYSSEEYEYYSEYENKSNIDLSSTIYSWDDGAYLADYCGKISKNLLKSYTDYNGDSYEYEYEFDEQGYVSTIKEYTIENGKKELSNLYHIFYVE